MSANNIKGYVMDRVSGGMIGVNLFGLIIAQFFAAGLSVLAIYERCKEEYEFEMSDEQLMAQIADFLARLEKLGLKPENTRILPKEEGKYQPLNVQIDLSWKCNLHCRHCYLDDTRLIDTPLSKEEWEGVIRQIFEMRVPKLTFLGGEPLLGPNFFDLASFAFNLGFKLFSTTNGTLITESVVKDYLRSGFAELDVSVDGATSSTHNFLRGKGTFSATLLGIEKLVAGGMTVKTATVLHKGNFKEVADILRLGRSLDVEHMYFNPLLPGWSGENFWQDQALSFGEWRDVKRVIRDWNGQNKKPVAFAESAFEFEGIISSTNVGSCDYAGCKAGKRELIITPDGYVAACPLVSTNRNYQTMNVRRDSLKHIWEVDGWIVKLRQINPLTVKGKCVNCESVAFCQGGCHMLAHFRHGSIDLPDPRCPY